MRFSLLVITIFLLSGCVASSRKVDDMSQKVGLYVKAMDDVTTQLAGIHPELAPYAAVAKLRADDVHNESQKGSGLEIPPQAMGIISAITKMDPTGATAGLAGVATLALGAWGARKKITQYRDLAVDVAGKSPEDAKDQLINSNVKV